MLIIPGFLIALVTFPGVIAHELAHLLFCRLYRVEVHKVCYFRLGNPSGYVLHEAPENPAHQVMIGVGPFFLNTLLGLVLGIATALFGPSEGARFALYWLALSIAMHAFPSTGDARGIWHAAWRRPAPLLLKLAVVPLVGFIYLFAFGSIIWLDAAYGLAIGVILPKYLTGTLQ